MLHPPRDTWCIETSLISDFYRHIPLCNSLLLMYDPKSIYDQIMVRRSPLVADCSMYFRLASQIFFRESVKCLNRLKKKKKIQSEIPGAHPTVLSLSFVCPDHQTKLITPTVSFHPSDICRKFTVKEVHSAIDC